MALISNANLKKYCDRLAWTYTQARNALGTSSGALGTCRGTLNALITDLLATEDYDQINGLTPYIRDVRDNVAPVEVAYAKLGGSGTAPYSGLIAALSKHCLDQGSTVDSTILSFLTYLSYYNTTKFTVLLTPDFATLYAAVMGASLAAANVMQPAIHPTYTSGVSSNGVGKRAVGGSYTAGTAADTTNYSAFLPLIEVTTNFANGAGAPTVTLAGTDDLGASVTWGPITLTGNNPTAALSGVTVTPAITIAARQTVTLSDATGIVAGSVLTINSGLTDQEIIIVESVNSNDITAVFRSAHNAGATVSGNNTYSAGNASSGASRRMATLTGITLGIGAHNAGAVRVVGRQDRVSI